MAVPTIRKAQKKAAGSAVVLSMGKAKQFSIIFSFLSKKRRRKSADPCGVGVHFFSVTGGSTWLAPMAISAMMSAQVSMPRVLDFRHRS